MSELKNVVVDAVSLVKKGANGEPIQIYKSADPNERPTEATQVAKADTAPAAEPEVTEKAQKSEETATQPATMEEAVQKSTHKALKELFAPILKAFTPEVVEKAADIDNHIDYNSFISRITRPETRLDEALDQLTYAIWDIFWDDSITNGKELILKNIDDFKTYVEGVLNGTREIQSVFFEKGDLEDMNKEDVAAAVTAAMEPLTKSIEGLTGKVEAMEKSAKEAAAPTETPAATETTPVEKSAEETPAATTPTTIEKSAEPDMAAIVKSAIAASMEPITKSVNELAERVGTIESMKGVSKGAQVTEVKKSEVVDEWPEFHL